MRMDVHDSTHTRADKYSQTFRTLLSICNMLLHLPMLYGTPALREYLDTECSLLDVLYLDILGDFFPHVLDGSGANNFHDVGSCIIDGHLTRAWNWCLSLEKC